jgi:hypothetical protein
MLMPGLYPHPRAISKLKTANSWQQKGAKIA